MIAPLNLFWANKKALWGQPYDCVIITLDSTKVMLIFKIATLFAKKI
jgi:hypothetical protein